jgi:hypothetical protein
MKMKDSEDVQTNLVLRAADKLRTRAARDAKLAASAVEMAARDEAAGAMLDAARQAAARARDAAAAARTASAEAPADEELSKALASAVTDVMAADIGVARAISAIQAREGRRVHKALGEIPWSDEVGGVNHHAQELAVQRAFLQLRTVNGLSVLFTARDLFIEARDVLAVAAADATADWRRARPCRRCSLASTRI